MPLAPELVTALKTWKLQCPAGPENLVFPNTKGGPLHRAQVIKALHKALDRCPDLPRITLHGTRHTFASLLILANRPVTQVSKLLGHKSPSLTLEVYSHWFNQLSSEDAVADLAAAVCGKTGSRTVAAAAG